MLVVYECARAKRRELVNVVRNHVQKHSLPLHLGFDTYCVQFMTFQEHVTFIALCVHCWTADRIKWERQ